MFLSFIQIFICADESDELESYEIIDMSNTTYCQLGFLNLCLFKIKKESMLLKENFEEEVKEMIKPDIISQTKKSNFFLQKKTKIDKSNTIDNQDQELQKKLRTMFFTKLIRLVHIFYSKMRCIILEETGKEKPLHREKLQKLFSDLDDHDKKWYEEKNITQESMNIESVDTLTIEEAVKYFEDAFCKTTDVKIEDLREFLYTTPEFNYDEKDKTHIIHFYFTLVYFLSYVDNKDYLSNKSDFIDYFNKTYETNGSNKPEILYEMVKNTFMSI
ncbi:hypothetical protein CDIK_1041 [Cucumispora dikerogammari]|nr:hypothetical protein CDIK_1041 [Cucumispora dikerogammari]